MDDDDVRPSESELNSKKTFFKLNNNEKLRWRKKIIIIINMCVREREGDWLLD